MKGPGIFFLTAALVATVSCKVHTVAPRPTVPVVREIVTDKNHPSHRYLKGLRPSPGEGAVYILGEPAGVLALTESFLAADRFDNATGRPVPDGLPDFSGECFAGILDEAGAPYSASLARDDGTLLREHCVRAALSALDTTCFLSPYDREGGVPKPPAKLLILASSSLAAYGQFDVDTLFRQMDCRVPVLSPLQCMMDEVFAQAEGEFNLGVLTERENLSTGIYSSMFAHRCNAKGLGASVCTVLSPRDSSELVSAFFDDYIAAGARGKLNYLMVDLPGQDAADLRERVDFLLSVMNPESLRYRGAIADDLKILLPGDCLLRRCYAEMRTRGLFSFHIAHPRAEGYLTVPALIPFSERYASSQTLEILSHAEKSRSFFYIQD
ncbi:MAG: hypothetical protein IJS62_02755 [Bacteroidales bacterium]|nr:hypothetical protein [Bacteroidales bacterium]